MSERSLGNKIKPEEGKVYRRTDTVLPKFIASPDLGEVSFTVTDTSDQVCIIGRTELQSRTTGTSVPRKIFTDKFFTEVAPSSEAIGL